MRRIITLTALALGLLGGVAAADRHDRTFGGNRGNRGPVVRDHTRGSRDRVVIRNNNNWNRGNTWNRGGYNRGNRTVVRVNRSRPTFRNGGFYFNGGVFRAYHRPVINVRYRNYYRRPALIVENYDPVPGYIWIQGAWNWNGYEWIWAPGHYEVDSNYVDSGYYYE